MLFVGGGEVAVERAVAFSEAPVGTVVSAAVDAVDAADAGEEEDACAGKGGIYRSLIAAEGDSAENPSIPATVRTCCCGESGDGKGGVGAGYNTLTRRVDSVLA